MNDTTIREVNARSLATAFACASAILFGPGPMIVGGLSLLMTAVAADFGWSRTMFSAVPLLTAWAAALTSPIFGRLMDRYGLRRVLLPGIAAFGLAFLLLSAVPRITWMFFGAYLLVGIVAGSQGPVGYNKIVCQWFVRHRGMVIAFAAAIGSGVGYALMPQVVNAMIVHHGWRSAYLVIAIAILFISLPIGLFFLREKDRPAELAGVPEREEDGLTRAEGIRTATFWKLVLVLFLGATVYYGMLLHLFPMLLDRGIDRTSATATISIVAIGAIVGQFSAGVLLDRMNTPKIGAFFFTAGLAGVVLIHHGSGSPMVFVGAVLLGIGQGAELSVIGYIASRLFGLRAFGALYGIIYAGAAAASGIGPMVMGIFYDRLGSYELALWCGEAALLVAFGLILSLGPYVYGGRSGRAMA